MNKNSHIILVFSIFFLMSSCTKDNERTPAVAKEGTTQLILSLPNQTDMTTRADVDELIKFECSIDTAFILVFRHSDDGKYYYKTGEVRYRGTPGYAGNASPLHTITTNLNVVAGDRVFVLANAGSTLPEKLKRDSSYLPDDIDDLNDFVNDLFPATHWDINQTGGGAVGEKSGYGMPMSGDTICTNPFKPIVVTLRRAVAKIQLAVDITDNKDLTEQFDPEFGLVSWGIHNVLKASKGVLYVARGTTEYKIAKDVLSSDFVSERDNDGTYPHVPANWGERYRPQLTYYMPEYPSATMAKGHPVDPEVFDPDRTCMIVRGGPNNYYRLDLYKDGKYIDIRRNSHYVITINEVNTWGFGTVDEALANPGSNVYTRSGGKPAIGYDIQVIDGK